MKRILLAALLYTVSLSLVHAQKAPIKFGKIDDEVVASKFYEPDSTVDAAVLCAYGVFNPNEFSFTSTTRFKIYSKEGLNFLIMPIPVKFKSQVRGVVYNMVDGKVVKSKLEKEHIYSERVSGSYTRLRIAPPDAREGSVIDIKYTMDGSIPREWNFQQPIPVIHSELRIPRTEIFSFNKRMTGYIPLTESSASRWVAKDMPPFIPEPYINAASNYMTTMLIEISRIHATGPNGAMYYKQYSSTWEDVAEVFDKDEDFGTIYRQGDAYLKEAADKIRASSSSDEELVANALAHIHQEVKWNKVNDMYPANTLRNIYLNEKTGTAADMNFLFLKLLKRLEVESYPMIMSLRSNGIINPHFPSISRFGYTACYVKVGDSFRVVDASDKYFGTNCLSTKCLNGWGFVLRGRQGEWVEIEPLRFSNRMINCQLTLSEDGLMEGKIFRQFSDYGAAGFRKSHEDYTTEEEYLEDFERSNDGIYVMDYQVSGTEQVNGPIQEEFEVEMEGMVNVSGDMIHLNPVLMDAVEENPFKLEKREYPVDFSYGRNRIFMLQLELPEGYGVEQLPKPVRLVNTDNTASFQYSVSQIGSKVQVMYRLQIKKPTFIMSEYEELKLLYDIIVNKEAEPLILKRVSP